MTVLHRRRGRTSNGYMRPITFVATALFVSAAAVAQTLPVAKQLPTGARPLAANPAATKFTFVVAGDNRPAHWSDPLTQPLLDMIERLAVRPPAFVVWDGDTVFGKH